MEDFLKPDHVMVDFALGERARIYYKEPITCNLVSYGSNIVASVKSEYRDLVWEYIHKFDFYHCFETPSMNWLAERLAPMGQKICFMAEYFLPDPDRLAELLCDYEIKILNQKDFSNLYRKEWSNALCEDRKKLDVLGAGAYDNGKLVGLAACSADCDSMWQIGVDVLTEYRRKGIASSLTSRLAVEILKRDKVPFYCCAWSNIRSARNAIRSGFAPAWVEMTVKPAKIVDKMNE
ncbi:MAG: GNAT family N-acetyltransferase [Lachnospiraceae bacterium]|nr:GNAT family N-acetyltransferase [Lachnospiraceae bacterium]